MTIPFAGGSRHSSDTNEGEPIPASALSPADARCDRQRHSSISMVEEPTKMLRGALAFFRGASCSIKFRDPIS
jgi:hypothetical protein